MDEVGVIKNRNAVELSAAQAYGPGLAGLLDELAHGVLVATPDGKMLHANQAAQLELASRKALELRGRQLETTDRDSAKPLQDALAKAANGRRSLLSLRCAGGWTLGVAVVPLRADAAQAPAVALMFSRASVCDTLMLCFFARAHGLTHSEEQVLAILCQGSSAPEIARRLDVAVSTVRSHVRSLCAKTQSSGVRALVKRVAVLPPLGPSRVHEPVH